MNRVQSLGVPWMVSPSVSDLRLTAVENGCTCVWAAVAVAGEAQGRYVLLGREIEISFRSGRWIRVSPAHSDRDTVPTDWFDMSGVQDPSFGPSDAWIALWKDSDVCPDSGFYEIEASSWLFETGADRYNCRHYLLIGSDSYIEILATEYAWTWMD